MIICLVDTQRIGPDVAWLIQQTQPAESIGQRRGDADLVGVIVVVSKVNVLVSGVLAGGSPGVGERLVGDVEVVEACDVECAPDGRVWEAGLDLEDADFGVGVVEGGEDLGLVVPGDFFGHF